MRPLRFLFLLLFFALPLFALDVPPAPQYHFTDRAGVLSDADAQALDRKLAAFEQQSGSQFIIYVFPSLDGESIEDFTIRCVEAWKVGQRKYDNGLVMFVFVQDRKVRVETGYGLEGTMTDAFSSRVIREQIAPHFQQNDYAGGLNAAADAIIARITGKEPAVEPMQRPGTQRGGQGESDFNPFTVLVILFIVFFVLAPMFTRRRSGCGGCFFPWFFFPGGGGGITFGGGGFGGGGGSSWGGGGFSGGGGRFGGGGATGGW